MGVLMNALMMLSVGLAIFIAIHSVRIYADDWRSAQVARFGLWRWKAVYGLISLIGFVLMVWGYDQTRLAPQVLWVPPVWTRHLAALLTLPAFVLMAAAYVPATRIKSKIGHPLAAGVKLWALAHLLANGNVADVVMFGALLVWAALSFSSARRRDQRTGTLYPNGPLSRDILALAVGVLAWGVFAVWLHRPLIGVAPFAV